MVFVQIVTLTVKEGHIDQFLEAFRINYEGTRREPGNVEFHLLRSRSEPRRFTVYEVFRSEEALAAHRATDHYKECIRRFEDLLEGDRSIEVMTPVMADYLDSGPA